jgi:AraC-like DNA-binding protein
LSDPIGGRSEPSQCCCAASQSDNAPDLAKPAGYADQAHLTRAAATLAGMTPRAFLDETRKTCGANHDHEASYAGLRREVLAARHT